MNGDVEMIQVELKYCERCGGLWLRAQGNPEVYCVNCALELMGMPLPSRRRHRPRLPVNHKLDVHTHLTACSEGGLA